MKERVSFRWIKERFFSDEHKMQALRKGEILLEHGQKNQRLYLVIQGKFLGYLVDSGLESYPIFEATPDKFIGVYSYFSDDNLSYSRVVADEDSVVCYYDKALQDHSQEEWTKLAPFLISVVVNELYSRQHFARKMALEKYNDAQRLLKAEKMATLGQMAAGLAHELNNSIGVIDRGVDHIKTFFTSGSERKRMTDFISFFNLGYEKGQQLSSEEARQKRKDYEKIKGLSDIQVKRLAKTGIDPIFIKKHLKSDTNLADDIYRYWEAGCTIHDMQIAARHSAHVVRSVRQLGVTEHSWAENIRVNDTMEEALVILKNLTKRVNTSCDLDEDQPLTSGCPGQLIQVWINVIKNGIESMVSAATPNAELRIASDHTSKDIRVHITDNGPGIPQEIMDKIFQPSFTTKVGGLSFGLGLGLSIVQRIITEHDGQIEVTSIPGKTTFTVKIPIIN